MASTEGALRGGTDLLNLWCPRWGICDDPVDVDLCGPKDLLGSVEACRVDKDEVSSHWTAEEQTR